MSYPLKRRQQINCSVFILLENIMFTFMVKLSLATAYKESLVVQPAASRFCHRASDFCSLLARQASAVYGGKSNYRRIEITCGLLHASYSFPEWQAIKPTFFAPWNLVFPVKVPAHIQFFPSPWLVFGCWTALTCIPQSWAAENVSKHPL